MLLEFRYVFFHEPKESLQASYVHLIPVYFVKESGTKLLQLKWPENFCETINESQEGPGNHKLMVGL